MIVANATGCSSIYGANLPTTPWTVNAAGRGPAWSNSLFEDNAEFGLGMRLALDAQTDHARAARRAPRPGARRRTSSTDSSAPARTTEADDRGPARAGRAACATRSRRSTARRASDARHLLALAGDLVRQGVWIIGGDGWAYDIGFGGLDHVLSSGRNVNILVLDTEVYSNTGGQASKATPRGAVAKFAAARQGHGQEGPRRRSPARTATSTSPRSRWARTTSRRRRRCSRRMPGRVRRSSSPTAPASPTAST